MALPLAMLGLQAAPALIGLAGNLFGGKRRKAQEDKASGGISNLADIFKGNLNQDYFDSAEGMGAMREIDENSEENMQMINSTANLNGLTDEARIAMMGKNMQAKQGAYAGLSRNSDLWRQRNLQNYGGALSTLFQVGQQNRQNFNNSLQNVVGGFKGAVDGATNVGAFDKWLGK